MPDRRDNGVDAWRARQGPLLYAHRGAHVEWPENSLPAFRAALDVGADVIETDVHLTSDGHVLISHDPSGVRTAGVAREIRACRLEEVRGWQLAGAPSALAPPTLDEVLEALPDAVLNVDVKQREPDMTEPLIATIARHGAEHRVLLTSFDHLVLARVRARYRGPTGLCRREAVAAFFAPRRLLGPLARAGCRLQIPVRFGPLALDTGRFIAKMHGLGLGVDYWVVDEVAEAERLLARGADGIVTDDPAAIARLFARSSHTAGWRARHPGLCGASA